MTPRVAVFWDHDSCPLPINTTGYETVENIRRAACPYGDVTAFRVYGDTSKKPNGQNLRSQLEISGLSLCEYSQENEPHIAAQIMIADVFLFAMDNPTPATIILITGNNAFAYTASSLRLRRYDIVLLAPLGSGIQDSLKSQASVVLDWELDVPKLSASRALLHGPFRTPPKEERSESKLSSIGGAFAEIDARTASTKSPSWRRSSVTSLENRPTSISSTPGFPAEWRRGPETTTYKPLHLRRLSSTMGETPVNMRAPDSQIGQLPHLAQPSLPATPGSGGTSLDMTAYRPLSRPTQAPFTDTNSNGPRLFEGSRQTQQFGQPPTLIPSSYPTVNLALVTTPPALTSSTLNQTSSKNVNPTSSQAYVSRGTPSNLTYQSNALPLDPPTHGNISSKTFFPLVEQLERLWSVGNFKPLRSLVGCKLTTQPGVYTQAGVPNFGSYAALAASYGIVELGGLGGKAWIKLKSNWQDNIRNIIQSSRL